MGARSRTTSWLRPVPPRQRRDQYELNPAVQNVMLEVRRDVVATRIQELRAASAALITANQADLNRVAARLDRASSQPLTRC